VKIFLLSSEWISCRRFCAALAVLLLATGVGAVLCATQEREEDPPPIAPPEPLPPPDAIEPPPVNRPPPRRAKPLPIKPAIAHCQRCGYVTNAGWRFCPACGWDHRALAGTAAGERLAQIQESVVGVVVIKEKQGFEDFLSPKQLARLRRYYWFGIGGQRKHFGSALPYGEDGLYVTSARILQRGHTAQLRNYRNHFIDAVILGYDLPSGIGILKAGVLNLEPLPSAEKEHEKDERSWVVCYPVLTNDGVVHYLPASIHSGRLIDRGYFGTQIVSFENLLRTDHTLPVGCRGGLLIDSLGMTAGIVLDSPDDGITYAQPLRDVLPIIEKLARGESIERPYYGMGLVMPDERRRARFGLPPDSNRPVVAYLIDESPALVAGVRRGDLVTAIDGEPVADVVEAGAVLLARPPGGAPVRLTVHRAGAQLEFMVRPAKRAARVLLDPVDEIQEALETNLVEVKTGKASRHGLRLTQLARGGRGEKDGYREGDIIRKIGRDSVRDFETFNRIVRKENHDIFSNEAERLGINARATYFIEMEVRTAEGETEERYHINLFPEMLAPPIY
jgi:serine protease Do